MSAKNRYSCDVSHQVLSEVVARNSNPKKWSSLKVSHESRVQERCGQCCSAVIKKENVLICCQLVGKRKRFETRGISSVQAHGNLS